MRFQSALLLASVAAGAVQAGPPKPYDSEMLEHAEGIPNHNEPYDTGSPAENIPSFGDDDNYGDDDCAAYANYPKFAGDGEEPHVPTHCKEGGRQRKSGNGWMVVKRQGDSLRDDIGNAVNDVGDRIHDDDNGGDDNDNGGNGNNDNGDDNDGPGDRNSAGGKTVPLLGVASVVAISFLLLT